MALIRIFDVVIVGGGLAGLQCARLLSRHGAKILLVDRKDDLSKGVHTTGIFVRKTLEDFDFPAGTLGNAVSAVSLYSPRLRALDLVSDNEEFRVGKMGLMYECMLRDCVTNGVEFAGGTRYISTRTARRGSVVTLAKNGKRYEVWTEVVIGADGANSRVARDLGLDENREWIVGFEEVYTGVPLAGEPRLHCFLDAELAPGYLAWISNDGDEAHIGVGGYAKDFDPREALRLFKVKVSGSLVDLENASLAETRGGRIPVGGVLKRISSRQGLLIGDAAGAVSPLTAGGLDPALRLSALAAGVVHQRLATGTEDVLLDYSGALFRGRFISRLWMRRVIAAVRSNALLELGCGILRGAIGRRAARHVFFGRGSFPDIKVGKSLPDLRGEAVSWR